LTRLGQDKREHDSLLALAIVAWIGNAIYAAGEAGGAVKEVASGVVALAMLGFFILHGRRQYSPGTLVAFVAIICVIVWPAEEVGISTGLPFGHYHYSPDMAPFLGNVPVVVPIVYVITGYLAWSLARIYIHVLARGNRVTELLVTPVLAAFFMVVWDLSMDPLRATHEGRWTWLEGGDYLGIPVSNFVGWFVVTWACFQIFAVFENGKARDPSPHRDWAVPVMYAAFAGEYLLNPVLGTEMERMVMINEQMVVAQDLYIRVATVCLFSMIPVALGGYFLMRIGENELPSAGLVRTENPGAVYRGQEGE